MFIREIRSLTAFIISVALVAAILPLF